MHPNPRGISPIPRAPHAVVPPGMQPARRETPPSCVGPRALDLFCGAGGVAKGLQRAGFHVTGIDIERQPRYCGDMFIQADALHPPVNLSDFDFIWASPPCQAYTVSRTRVAPARRKVHPELIEPTRAMLRASGVPFVIENVVGAPLRLPALICGGSMGLGADCADGERRQLARHRWFESSFMLMTPGCQCDRREKIGVYGNGGGWANRFAPDRRGYKGNVGESRQAMGMPWATIAELSQAIPPAYAEYIGRAAIQHIHGTGSPQHHTPSPYSARAASTSDTISASQERRIGEGA